MPKIKPADININYELEGVGKTVVFINGITMDLHGWDYQVHAFTKHFQVLRYDCRGQGLTDKPVMEYTHDIHSTDLKYLIDILKINKVSVVGLSNGGMVALHFALRYPEMIDKLVLVDTCSYVDTLLSLMIDIWIRATRLGGNEFRYDVTVPFIFSNNFVTENTENILKMKEYNLRINDPNAIINLAKACKGHDVSKSIKDIDIPTLIMVGDQDILIPPRHSEYLHRNIRNSKFIRIDGCGHIPSIEKPELFNKTVIEFIRE